MNYLLKFWLPSHYHSGVTAAATWRTQFRLQCRFNSTANITSRYLFNFLTSWSRVHSAEWFCI